MVLDTLGPTDEIRTLTIDWGDSSPDTVLDGFGRSIDVTSDHTYTGAGPFTISIEITMRVPDDITFNETLNITPNLSADYLIDQIQIERICQNVPQFATDWADVSRIPLAFIDNDVRQGNAYKYRLSFRTLDATGAPSVTTQVSALTTQNPWT
ncbi:MAG: hypothetical protein GTN93_00660 [Anaerolineae bacterium]|nr:hypothetical protein [Anaerolineae bacterium]